MIFKKITGNAFGGALNYIFNDKDNSENRATLLDTNCGSQEATGIALEMRKIADCRRTYSKPVHHVVMSHHEQLTPEQWQDTAKLYMEKMGYGDKHQYALVHHKDKEHDHCHLIINGVNMEAKGISNSHDFARQAKASKEITEELGLSPIPKKQQSKHIGNDNLIKIQDAIDTVMSTHKTIKPDEFEKQLASLGIIAKRSENTKGIQGYSFKLDGSNEAFTGKRLGADYKLSGLEARGLDTGKVKEQLIAAERAIHPQFDVLSGIKKSIAGGALSRPTEPKITTTKTVADIGKVDTYEEDQKRKQQEWLARAEENDARMRQAAADRKRLQQERQRSGPEL